MTCPPLSEVGILGQELVVVFSDLVTTDMCALHQEYEVFMVNASTNIPGHPTAGLDLWRLALIER